MPRRESDTCQEHAQLANDELIMLLVILLVAGNETTRNAISGGMQLLIEHPTVRRRLIDQANLARMEMIVAFEEILRRLPDLEYDGPGPVLRPSALVRSCVSMPVRAPGSARIAR